MKGLWKKIAAVLPIKTQDIKTQPQFNHYFSFILWAESTDMHDFWSPVPLEIVHHNLLITARSTIIFHSWTGGPVYKLRFPDASKKITTVHPEIALMGQVFCPAIKLWGNRITGQLPKTWPLHQSSQLNGSSQLLPSLWVSRISWWAVSRS